MKNLPIQSLAFEDIRTNLVDHLRGNPAYKDFDFDASGISTLVNLLAYNTHYIGYYVKMMLDESFVDTAHNRQALLSHAKRTGYIARGRRAARAEVQLEIFVEEGQVPSTNSILISRGTSFSGSNSVQDRRQYQVLEDVIVTDSEPTEGGFIFRSPPITIYEGSLDTWRFVVDADVHNQRFIINEPNIDIDTLRVDVLPNINSTEVTQFKRADDIFELDGNSNVFFVTTNEDGLYQIFFGNGVFGRQPEHGNVIRCSYIRTNGESGNGAKRFIFNAPEPNPLADYDVGNFEDFTVKTLSIASGGMEPETVDSLRFTIPHHFRRQNRIVTVDDFRAVLLSEFRNIDSISVWDGARADRREYGKVMVSIKPKFSDSLTTNARKEIKDAVVNKYGVVGTDIIFVDPEFIEANVTIHTNIDSKKTNLSKREIERELTARVKAFNQERLNRFDAILSDVEMLEFLKKDIPAIRSIYSTKELEKNYKLMHGSTGTHVITFGNPIELRDMRFSPIRYGNEIWEIINDATQLYLHNPETKQKILIGSVDTQKGSLTLKLPTWARVDGYENTSVGILKVTVTPKNPDVNTHENNIVRIGAVRVYA